ncbi:MAG: hypothetical protein J2P48_07535 [Alphaproteobacteria bacterium]|nr:hypothetical protein [Alphaproteobacteria bacterium]
MLDDSIVLPLEEQRTHVDTEPMALLAEEVRPVLDAAPPVSLSRYGLVARDPRGKLDQAPEVAPRVFGPDRLSLAVGGDPAGRVAGRALPEAPD